jgi:hypothetical protein
MTLSPVWLRTARAGVSDIARGRLLTTGQQRARPCSPSDYRPPKTQVQELPSKRPIVYGNRDCAAEHLSTVERAGKLSDSRQRERARLYGS